ncbi:hypothetical protein QNO08_17195 (plasmid) [Arthrobacter sp. zg-Y820]|uniref:hypothetical protein n=1 Tax=unclassified Arthrobacter TaxID=235627 RepID=UPI001E3111F7|nr:MULTISPECIES: hypothetical protein [unclassified Arthrobacter]MCC9198535.1 hypothetical protein [Arthrobacter sp. zg-Y820]MDK1281405.1 hypothetical protein [Arthrobacter sp. zg.Y820]WIB11251.1 hypothetical protein QNO08_17195 [Arthrobacter sp. zg-Y820]
MMLSEIPLTTIRNGRQAAILVGSFTPTLDASLRVVYIPAGSRSTISGRVSTFLKRQADPYDITVTSSTDHHVLAFDGRPGEVASALAEIQRIIKSLELLDSRGLYSTEVTYPKSLLPIIQDQIWRKVKPQWIELKSDKFSPGQISNLSAASQMFVLFRGLDTIGAEEALSCLDDSLLHAPGRPSEDFGTNLRGSSKAIYNFGAARSSVILSIPTLPSSRPIALAQTAALQYLYADSVSLLFSTLRDHDGLCYSPRVISHRSTAGSILHTIFSIEGAKTASIEDAFRRQAEILSEQNRSYFEDLSVKSHNSLAKWIRYSTASNMILEFLIQILIMSSDRSSLVEAPEKILDLELVDIVEAFTMSCSPTRYFSIIT